MKFKIFMMLVTLGIMSVTPMIYMGKFDPMSLLSGGYDDGVSEIKKLKAKAPKNLTNVMSDEKVQVYKWRDENGVMQFSNTPPPDGGRSEQVTVDPNSNLMKAVKAPVVEEENEPVAQEAPSPYSPKGMKKAMDDAKGIEEMLKKRHEDQQQMMKNL